MRVKVELTPEELEESGCDTVEEFKKGFVHQLNEGVIGDDGAIGEDWLPAFDVEVILV